MVDYSALKRKFPNKNPNRRKKKLALKAVQREYEAKRAQLSGGPPVVKRGFIYYAVIIIGLLFLGSVVLTMLGKGGPARISRAQVQAQKSVDAVAIALGRYRYHVGRYPATEEGLKALSEITPQVKGWNGPYVNHVVPDMWGHDYVYVNNGENESPTVYSKGADGLAGTTDDVLADRSLFDQPFKDTSWTKGWMPYQLRGYVLAQDEVMRAAIKAEVKAVLDAEAAPEVGEFFLREGWEFSRDGKSWKKVRLPHDWAVEFPFDLKLGGDTGALPWKGEGVYRKTVKVPASSAGKFVALRFGGAMANPEVFLNGEKVGGWDYGYMTFEVDVSQKIKFGEDNELVVKVDTEAHRSRWYPGAGLYRDVKLVIEDSEDRAIWGSVKITTPEITKAKAKVRVEYLTPVSASVIVNEFEIENPVLWDVVNPKLYETVICGKTYRYGIRTAEFTADDGFRLNGRRVQLKGVNLHSDLGPLGMAFDKGAMRRQLERMKDMGVNAIRTSHNACAPELLDLCDEMGFVVWNECFDKWDSTAGISETPEGIAGQDEYVVRNLRQFVRRDRNHPSVVCWSIGNEIWLDGEAYPHPWKGNKPYPQGTSAARCSKYRDAVRAEDVTRPVGIGCCFQQAIERGDYAALDLTGWNYREQYRPMKAKYPAMPVVYSESASAFSTHGYYPDVPSANPTNYVGGRDTEIDGYDRCAASWADIPDLEFARMERDRYCGGEFVWTGIDYLGEPSPSSSICRSSFFGICDLCALPKDRYYLYRSVWNDRSETVHLLPHWTWDGREGEKVSVACYTSGDEAELFLNGESQGRRKKATGLIPDPLPGKDSPDYYKITERYRLTWEVPYEPGEIKVVAYRNGRYIGEDFRKTAFKPAAVRLTPEKPDLADGELGFVVVELTDDDGTPVPRACDRVSFALEGPGEIVAVGNGSMNGLDSFKAVDSHPLFYGRALVIVRRTGGSGLPLKLTASVPKIRSATVAIERR
jgi:beta-galactosidase